LPRGRDHGRAARLASTSAVAISMARVPNEPAALALGGSREVATATGVIPQIFSVVSYPAATPGPQPWAVVAPGGYLGLRLGRVPGLRDAIFRPALSTPSPDPQKRLLAALERPRKGCRVLGHKKAVCRALVTQDATPQLLLKDARANTVGA
jgi:hypothetical protein